MSTFQSFVASYHNYYVYCNIYFIIFSYCIIAAPHIINTNTVVTAIYHTFLIANLLTFIALYCDVLYFVTEQIN